MKKFIFKAIKELYGISANINGDKLYLIKDEKEVEPTVNELAEINTEINRLKAIADVKKEQKAFNDAILLYLDTQCKEKGFTGDNKTRPYRAVANYVGFDNVFRAEAEKLGAWIALTFQVAEQIEADVIAGNRDMPTVEEVLSELPVYE